MMVPVCKMATGSRFAAIPGSAVLFDDGIYEVGDDAKNQYAANDIQAVYLVAGNHFPGNTASLGVGNGVEQHKKEGGQASAQN